jgi:hypothetical protein
MWAGYYAHLGPGEPGRTFLGFYFKAIIAMRKFIAKIGKFSFMFALLGLLASSCVSSTCGSTPKKRKQIRAINRIQYR